MLTKALEAFWECGFEATSLDDLSAATGLNRPSLYAAFGDKESIYLAALQNWTQEMRTSLTRALDPRLSVSEALMRFYQTAITLYLSGTGRGCMAICTAPSTVAEHPRIHQALADILSQLDAGLETYLRHAQSQGALPPDFDCPRAARVLAAVQHSLAIRARAGESGAELLDLARVTVAMLIPE